MMMVRSGLAGIAISIGCLAYLSVENHVIGAFLFSLGLLLVCTNDYQLFTGKLCYARKPIDFLELVGIWLGNLVGCAMVAGIVWLSRPELIQVAKEVVDKKPHNFLSIILMGFMCNLLIFFAVNGFKTNKHKVGKYFVLILCVMVFILCGFEHCIANAFYMLLADVVSVRFLLLNTLGNFLGGFWVGFLCSENRR